MKDCANCKEQVGDLRPVCPKCGGVEFTWPDDDAPQSPTLDERPAAINENAPAPDAPEPPPEADNIVTRRRYRIERLVFVLLTAVIAGLAAGGYTDLGPFGLMLLVFFIMVLFYSSAKTLLDMGGFSEIVDASEEIPAFDWKRFALDPLYFIGVCLALFLVVGLGMLIKWALSNGNSPLKT